MRKTTFLSLLFYLLIVFSFSACSVFEPDLLNTTPTIQPPGVSVPIEELVEIKTPSIVSNENVTIYLIAIEDAGVSGKKIGCDDSLVPFELPNTSTLDFPWNAVETLLSLKESYVSKSGFYNAFYQSDLKLIHFETQDGIATVELEGELMLGGVCDSPRIEEQLYATILQDNRIADVNIYINGKKLEDVLSLK